MMRGDDPVISGRYAMSSMRSKDGVTRVSTGLSIIPILEVDGKDIADIVTSLQVVIEFEWISLRSPLMEVPSKCFNKTRGKYEARELLALIATMKRERDEIMLGVTMSDLSYPGLNFVFGIASDGDAVISLCRLRQEYYGLMPERQLFLIRATKEAVHEIGHVLGLGHCESPSCVMFFSNSIHDTDLKGHHYCASCATTLSRSGIASNST